MTGYRAGARLCVTVGPRGKDEKRPRGQRQFETTLERECTNLNQAFRRLELLLYANFSPQDWFVTLTYAPEHLPKSYDEAQKRIKAYLRRVRAALLARGLPPDYIYVIEGYHGDKRVHHHLVCKRGPEVRRLLKELWTDGYVHVIQIRKFRAFGKSGLWALASYMTKEPRKTGRLTVGRRMWTPSIGLVKPARVDFDLPAGQTLELPPGTRSVNDLPFPMRHDSSFGTFSIYDVVLPDAGAPI